MNNCHTTPVTLKSNNNELGTTVNVASKDRKVFAAIKILDPFISSINVNITISTHPDEFPRADYLHAFKLVSDKKSKFLYFPYIVT